MSIEKMKALRKEAHAFLAAGDRILSSPANDITSLQKENIRLREERDRWQQIAEDESWPFEWEIATELKRERDTLSARIDELEMALRYCWRKSRLYKKHLGPATGLELIEKRIVETGVMGNEDD